MLTFFPKPYPDELLYSIIARYHVWSGNDEMSDSMEQLFGDRRERATLLIPKHFKYLAEKTKEFGLSYETLLYEHTIFPLITCFLSKNSYDHTLQSVINENQLIIPLCIYKDSIYPRFLKYCPHCIMDDRDEYGEAYWHRKHQSFGVEMCDKHRCLLKESDIEIIDSRSNRYIALNLLNEITVTLEEENIPCFNIELQIAYDIDYIYKNYEFIRRMLWEKHSSIRETTIALLFNRKLATQKGLVKNNRLRHEFNNKYISTCFKQILLNLQDNKTADWLITLCRGGKNTVVPIRFILFTNFLAGSLESFMGLLNEQEKFIDKKKEEYNPPNGYEEKLVQYRKRWLDAWNKNPCGCRSDLKKSDSSAYTWLIRHDHEWLLNHLPQIKKPKVRTKVKDWIKIDNELESLVEKAVYKIKNSGGKPERITIANIRRYIRPKVLLQRNYKLLPKTMYKIGQYVETIYDYRLRKIEWAKSELEKEGKSATPHIVLQKSGIRPDDWNKFRQLLTS
ncbi:TnsD family Tn7-like transposition protein [Anaerocolumna sp. AGMB13025]|uniref:TnsD family Tn7-like transposition protein n=1 Tax=Anaerocolumna sp. AGMB13025 TaxID=3039116 RepID=UPI00241F0D16|nr:TnsD family Tn7-like transposition protein [Anaerocolumna sp. AGMB13025]WFR57138.1 TnsD family Tn7-like transposition protein [Anaerocolumna sp. AGMB13025]